MATKKKKAVDRVADVKAPDLRVAEDPPKKKPPNYDLTEADREKGRQVVADRSAALKRLMIEALEYYLGIVTPAAEMAGIARTTHYDWMKEDPVYKAKVEALSDVALDFAERKLIQSIKRGSDTATIFYLKTKGKKRGYIERSELDLQGQLALNWTETKNYLTNGPNGEADGSDRPAGGSED